MPQPNTSSLASLVWPETISMAWQVPFVGRLIARLCVEIRKSN